MTMMKSLTLTALAFAAIVAVPQEAAAFSATRSLAQPRAEVRPTSTTPLGSITHIYNAKTSHNVGSLQLSAAKDELDGTSDGDKKIEGRKKRVIMGYKAMIISYLSAGLLSAAKATMFASLVQTIIGYLLVPAGISYIMVSAAKHDRLSSDTYKRLNLALLQYGLIGLSIVSMGGNNSMLKLSFVLTVINTIKGYTYGAIGWDKQSTETTLLKDLVRVTQDTTKGFFSLPKKHQSIRLSDCHHQCCITEVYEIVRDCQVCSSKLHHVGNHAITSSIQSFVTFSDHVIHTQRCS